MSVEENAAPKRRSSAANRRRSRKAGSRQSGATTTPQVDNATVATTDEAQPAARPTRGRRRRTAEAEPVPETAETTATSDPLDKAARRREERKKAKQQQPERSGVGKVVNTERFGGLRKFYNDTSSEIRKVVWPDRESTRNLTIVVIALSTILGFLLGGIDWVLFQLFEAIG
ncbi:MAG TPA: preprotein translocase subunit SecE [Thermomicrobiales bacterium]|nr:preprotein translocase subunit SecE [Thermomicrobiales bacterium]